MMSLGARRCVFMRSLFAPLVIQAARMLDADETPESSACKKQKRSSRRETADFTDLQDLLSTPDTTTPPIKSNPGNVAKEAESSFARAEPVDKAPSQGHPLGGHVSKRSPTLGGGGGGADAIPRKGFQVDDERRDSGDTADVPVLLGLFERGTEEDVSSRYNAEGSAVRTEGHVSSPHGGGRGGGGGGGVRNMDRRESVETASAGSVLGLLECTPSPGGGLDQSVADGSALRGKSLARLYDDADATDSDTDSPVQGVSRRQWWFRW